MATRSSQYNLVEPALIERRTTRRLSVHVSRATTRRHGESADEATLHDLSIYGCRMTLGEREQAGERLWIRFDGGLPVAATVVWSDGDLAGCRFDEPIDRSVMRKLTIGVC
jgi:PilZ domain